MRKIIIADDDFIVRTYLKQMLDWENTAFYSMMPKTAKKLSLSVKENK